MTDPGLPPAINGVELRLDALIAELRALRDLLTPVAEPESDTVELREPERQATATGAAPIPKARRRR